MFKSLILKPNDVKISDNRCKIYRIKKFQKKKIKKDIFIEFYTENKSKLNGRYIYKKGDLIIFC